MPNCWFSIHRVQYVSAKSNVQYSLVPLSSSSVRTNNILSQNSNSISAWYWHLESNVGNVTFSLALLNVSSVYTICVHIAHWHLLLVLAFRALWQVNRSDTAANKMLLEGSGLRFSGSRCKSALYQWRGHGRKWPQEGNNRRGMYVTSFCKDKASREPLLACWGGSCYRSVSSCCLRTQPASQSHTAGGLANTKA